MKRLERVEALIEAQHVIIAAQQRLLEDRSLWGFLVDIVRGLPGERAFWRLHRTFNYLNDQAERLLNKGKVAAVVLILIVTSANGQQPQRSSVTGLVGGNTPGLGTPAGTSLGVDLRLPWRRVEVASRTIYSGVNKVGSSGGNSLTERLVVRFGESWFVGGGVMVGRISGDFGSRIAIAPLIHGGYRYNYEKGDVVGFVTVRPYEWGTNHTRDHGTKGAEFAVEARRRVGRWVVMIAAGSEYLTFRNVDDPTPRSGAKAFVRAGIGWRW